MKFLFNIDSEIMMYHDGRQFLGKDCEAKKQMIFPAEKVLIMDRSIGCL